MPFSEGGRGVVPFREADGEGGVRGGLYLQVAKIDTTEKEDEQTASVPVHHGHIEIKHLFLVLSPNAANFQINQSQ